MNLCYVDLRRDLAIVDGEILNSAVIVALEFLSDDLLTKMNELFETCA